MKATDRATMPLLDRVTQQALEEDYAHVAQRKAERRAAAGESDPEGGADRTRLGRAAVVAAVFGLLVSTAAVQVSRDAATDETSRTTLVGRVNEGRDRATALQRRVADLRAETEALSSDLESLESREQSASAVVERLRLATGYGPAAGPGVRIVVDDSADGSAQGVVRTADLRHLVYGLWQAGAEAVAINGQRLTARSPIVTSGGSISVNQRSLTSPYIVEAIGDTRTLQVDLNRTAYGEAFFTVAQFVGLQVQEDNVARLVLPAAAEPMLRYAEPFSAAERSSAVPSTTDPEVPS